MKVCRVVSDLVPIVNVAATRRYSVIQTLVLDDSRLASRICCEVAAAFPFVAVTRLQSGALELTLLRGSIANNVDTNASISDSSSSNSSNSSNSSMRFPTGGTSTTSRKSTAKNQDTVPTSSAGIIKQGFTVLAVVIGMYTMHMYQTTQYQ
jgi:hypothetical protein